MDRWWPVIDAYYFNRKNGSSNHISNLILWEIGEKWEHRIHFYSNESNRVSTNNCFAILEKRQKTKIIQNNKRKRIENENNAAGLTMKK